MGELAAGLPVSRPAVSKHLRLMKEAGVVRMTEEGTRNLYELDLQALDEVTATSTEVTFTEDGPSRTRVDLEHRHLDRLGAAAAEMRAIFESDGGWPGLLALYAEQAQAAA